MMLNFMVNAFVLENKFHVSCFATCYLTHKQLSSTAAEVNKLRVHVIQQ